jgi:cobalt-zinc-cadmium resistance protein CzcA
MLSGVRGDLAIKIYGTDLHELNTLAEQTVQLIQSIHGAEDVLTVKNDGVQYLQLELDRTALAHFGLSVEGVQNSLRAMVEGRTTGVVIEQGRRVPLLIRGNSGTQMNSDEFAQLRLPIENGAPIALNQVAKLTPVAGPVKIDRENAYRMAVVRSNVRGRDLVGFVDEAKVLIAQKLKLPTGYRITWGGQFENQQRAAARLALVVPVALVLIFLILFSTLGSLKQAGLVLVNIPFALIGGVFALAITREYLSVPASVGFIALMGIAVLNGLVMVTGFNQLLAKGMEMKDVIIEGAHRRLRPVLMTASITAFGLVPVLFSTGPGSEIQRPLAIVVIGGLISSTLLTLVLLPSLFLKFGQEPAQ